MSEIDLLHPGLAVLFAAAGIVLLLRRRFLRFSVQHPRADRFAGCGFGKPPVWLFLPRLLDWVVLLLLVAALMEPVLPVGQRKTVVKSLDLVLCIDLSSSMAQKLQKRPRDAPRLVSSRVSEDPSIPTRMDATKRVALDFIRSRPQDRIGLVVFSANAYVVNPLTTDHRVLSEYISMLNSNTLIGEGLTSVGAGLQTSNQLISFFSGGRKGEGTVVIVLTDAEQNYGLKPNAPLEESRRSNIKVYFVGIGEPIENILFDQIGLVRATGGDAFNADTAADLQRVSEEIDRLERNPVEVTEYFRNQALAEPLLFVALSLALLAAGLRALPAFYVTG